MRSLIFNASSKSKQLCFFPYRSFTISLYLSTLLSSTSLFGVGKKLSSGFNISPETERKSTVFNEANSSDGKHGWYIFVDPLCWFADAGNVSTNIQTDFAVDLPSAGTIFPFDFSYENIVDYKHPHVTWDPGVRCGMGMLAYNRAWDVRLTYTLFYTKQSYHADLSVEGFIPIPVVNLGVVPPITTDVQNFDIVANTEQEDKISRTLHFNELDLQVGCPLQVSKALVLRPHVGIEAAIVHQNIHTHLEDTPLVITEVYPGSVFKLADVELVSKSSNKFWGVGIAGGIDSKWMMVQSQRVGNFSLFADGSGALLYGNFRMKKQSSYGLLDIVPEMALFAETFPPFIEWQSQSRARVNTVSSMLRGIFGFGWDRGLAQNKAHIGISAGYEFQVWFQQNQFIGQALSDLTLQGLTFEVRGDF